MARIQKKQGQGLVEYCLLVALLALVCVAVVTSLGNEVSTGLMGNIASSLSTANANIGGS